jgi:hypothetical protein
MSIEGSNFQQLLMNHSHGAAEEDPRHNYRILISIPSIGAFGQVLKSRIGNSMEH